MVINKKIKDKSAAIMVNVDKTHQIEEHHNVSVDNKYKHINSNALDSYFKEDMKSEIFIEYQLSMNEKCIVNGEVCKVHKVYFSENYAKIQFNSNKKEYLYKKQCVRLEKSYDNLMSYYRRIAQSKDKNMKGFVEKYLENQIDEIDIRKDDLLDIYFSRAVNKLKIENYEPVIFPFGINLSQREAIINALNNRVSIIQGPPGTGKTQSILNILANLVVQNKTVAVVSSNNEAIKNVLEKMQKNDFDFLIALLGKKENKENFFNTQKGYTDNINDWIKSEEELKELLLQIQKHEKCLAGLLDMNNQKAVLNQKLFEYKHEYKHFNEYFQRQDIQKLKRFSFFNLNSEKLLKLLVDLDPKVVNIESVFTKIKNLFKYGIYDFKQYKHIDPIILELQNQYYKEKIAEIEEDIYKIDCYLEKENYEQQLFLLEQKSKSYFQAVLAKKYGRGIRRFFNIKDYNQPYMFENFIQEYPIILATTHSIAKSKADNYTFDYVIIDEASQVELVPGIIALHTAKNVVIVGDLKQLPHIPDEKIKPEEYETLRKEYNIEQEYDYYKHSLLSSVDMIFNDDVKVMLREHYRCNHRIIEFCNRKYYNHQLVCLSNKQNKDSLVLLKTVPGAHLRYLGNKIINIRELESLMDRSFIEEAGIDIHANKTFGFISPFRGQVEKSEDILYSEFQKDTVHKFQGRECDTILFSSVLDNKCRVDSRVMLFVDEPRLINVALSRAVEKFILVSHVDTFLRRNGELNDLIKYMQYYQENSLICESKVRSIFDLLYSDYADELAEMKKRKTWGKSRYTSENLLYEFLNDTLDFSRYNYVREIKLKELVNIQEDFSEREIDYINHNASVDVAIYSVYNKQPVLIIEVDGFKYHDNNPSQLERDELKNNILRKVGIPLLRLKTVGSNEKEKINQYL
ncbi:MULTISPECIES: AAA domain-containing protein [unclassified Granulicatella]|uniref:AAA domain-containing protein n=1 Tax=unclassified Granulicatella TaxID=2630493 RepID=UPI0010730C18|nr:MULTISPECIES: AAA domain-containing protein [unclassified Granulicatella]MBF0780636.1 AAA family ATPase [Granulicatella sp. 19428wC4_WM01]TFU94565.1 DUF2726 domain-containing protein [Granulicatella sp. WM01]